jgi:hypothetical protein
MFGFDLYKRQKCILKIGYNPKRPLEDMIETAINIGKRISNANTRRLNPEDKESTTTGANKDTAKTTTNSSRYKNEALVMPCYWMNLPAIDIQQSWEPNNNVLTRKFDKVMGGVREVSRIAPVLSHLTGDGLEEIGHGLDATGGILKNPEVSNTDKATVAITATLSAVQSAMRGMTTEQSTWETARTLDWKGSGPARFSVDLLFCNHFTGVHMGALYPLIAASSFSQTGFGNMLWGPYGYNSLGFGLDGIKEILTGKVESLHSLTMWYDSDDPEWEKEEETALGAKYKGDPVCRKIVTDLHNLLLIEKVNITRSEQLYYDPGVNNIPLYKWIKATVHFVTACPIPGVWMTPEGVDGFNAETDQSNWHNFAGSKEVFMDDIMGDYTNVIHHNTSLRHRKT